MNLRTDDPEDAGYHSYDNRGPCKKCGHDRWEHSLMATRFVDVGCRELIFPPNDGKPYECHCTGFVRS